MLFIHWNKLKSKVNDIKCDINGKVRDIETKARIQESKGEKSKMKPMYIGTGPMISIVDVETEGKKRGYNKAVKEYEPIFREIENQYYETKKTIEEEKNNYGLKSDRLITRLEELEKEKDALQRAVNERLEKLSKEYNIPVGKLSGSLALGGNTLGLLGILLSYSDRKLKKSEEQGYIDAKELYEEKISRLKRDLNALKNKGAREINDLVNLISEVHSEIAENKMRIAQLQIMM